MLASPADAWHASCSSLGGPLHQSMSLSKAVHPLVTQYQYFLQVADYLLYRYLDMQLQYSVLGIQLVFGHATVVLRAFFVA